MCQFLWIACMYFNIIRVGQHCGWWYHSGLRFGTVISNIKSVNISLWFISWNFQLITLTLGSQWLFNEKMELIQIIICHQATSYYLKWICLRCLESYGVTRGHWDMQKGIRINETDQIIMNLTKWNNVYFWWVHSLSLTFIFMRPAPLFSSSKDKHNVWDNA